MIAAKKLSIVFAGAVLSTFCLKLEVAQAHPGHSPSVPHDSTSFSRSTSEKVLIVPPDAPDRPQYSVSSGITTFLAYDDETNGVLSLFKDVIPPGNGATPHLHTREDEFYYLLDGTAEVVTGSQTRIATAGDLVFLPKGKRHGFTNIGDIPLQMLVGVTPAGFEGFFSGQGKPVTDRTNPPPPQQDLALLGRLAQEYGTELALDPLTPSKGLTSLDFLVTNRNTPGRPSFSEDGGFYTSLATPEETGGQFSFFDVALAPQTGAAELTSSNNESQSFYVLEGDVTFNIADKTTVGKPGTLVYLPKDTPYTFQNLGSTGARTLLLKTPARVPEPASVLGLLTLGTLGAVFQLKRKQKQTLCEVTGR